jgi:hypothetical protein
MHHAQKHKFEGCSVGRKNTGWRGKGVSKKEYSMKKSIYPMYGRYMCYQSTISQPLERHSEVGDIFEKLDSSPYQVHVKVEGLGGPQNEGNESEKAEERGEGEDGKNVESLK